MRSTQACVGFAAAAALTIHHGFALAQPVPAFDGEAVPAPLPTPTPAIAATGSQPFPTVFLGARLGLGELHLRVGETNTWGRSYPIEAWAGVALTRRLVLFFEVYDAHVFTPSSTYAELTALNLVGLGPGLKYYLTHSHLYLSASLLLSRASFSNGLPKVDLGGNNEAIDEHTRWGATGRVALGKDWQVSPNWRLGLEGDVLLGRTEYAPSWGGGEEKSTVKGFSLLFSATYHNLAADQLAVPAYSVKPHSRNGLYLDAHLGVGKLEASFGGAPASARIFPLALSAGWPVNNSGYGLVDVDLMGFGPGAMYYLTPSNLFASCSLLVTELSYRDGTPLDSRYGTDVVSNWGFTGRLSIGKELWVSSNWGLGLAGELLLGRMRTPDIDASLSVRGFSLLASASFN